MSDVIITGWKPGLQTISLMRLLRANSDMTLQQAKQAVEELMDGKEICLRDISDGRASELREQIEALNGICGDDSRRSTRSRCDSPGVSDEPDSLDEFAHLWDGSEPGWMLWEVPDKPGTYLPINTLTRMAKIIEIDEINERVCQRMKESGCEVLKEPPKDQRSWDPPGD
jgi:hypothetical protein